MFRGRKLTYEVTDGGAVLDRDIVMVRAEEMEPEREEVALGGGGVPGPRQLIGNGFWERCAHSRGCSNTNRPRNSKLTSGSASTSTRPASRAARKRSRGSLCEQFRLPRG